MPGSNFTKTISNGTIRVWKTRGRSCDYCGSGEQTDLFLSSSSAAASSLMAITMFFHPCLHNHHIRIKARREENSAVRRHWKVMTTRTAYIRSHENKAMPLFCYLFSINVDEFHDMPVVMWSIWDYLLSLPHAASSFKSAGDFALWRKIPKS